MNLFPIFRPVELQGVLFLVHSLRRHFDSDRLTDCDKALTAAYASTTRLWFEQLSGLLPSKAAFWQPTPAQPGRIKLGERWYFKELGAPQILGFGEYVGWEKIGVAELFSKYGAASGYASLDDLVEAFRTFDTALNAEALVGNVILENFTPLSVPLSLSEIPLDDLSVRFIYLPEADPIAGHIAGVSKAGTVTPFKLRDTAAAKRAAVIRKIRTGQSDFRKRLLETYGPVCAMTGPQIAETLQAAHIQPYVDAESNHICNGLILRADLHILFDLGFLTIDHSCVVRVSKKLKGRDLAIDKLDGVSANLENSKGVAPSFEAIDFHFTEVFEVD